MKLRNLNIIIIALTLAASVPTLVNAQQTQEPARTEDRSEGFDLGWLGLLGLGGLFGLKRREPDTVRDRDRVAMNTRS
jgi:MYXO-CTERM domain-containing protein